MRLSCYTLSNAFDISRKTYLTSKPLSNDLYFPWVIAKKLISAGATGFKSRLIRWDEFIFNIELKINFSKVFPQTGSRDTGRWIFKYCHLFYELELHSLFFHSVGEELLSIDCLRMRSTGLQIELSHNRNMRILILSWPWALLGSKFCSIFAVSYMDKFTVNMRLSVL